MIPYEWIDEIPDALVEMYAEAETAILCDMADRISQLDFYGSAVQWQERMLQEMGLTHDYIVATLSKMTDKTTDELEALITEAGGQVLQSNAFLTDIGYNLQSVTASEVWKARLAEGLKKTGKLFENLTSTTASVGASQFRHACDMAYMQVETGAFSPNEAIANAVRRLSREGVQTVEYHGSTGTIRRDNVDVAVRRAVVTGINQTTARLQLAINEELGLDLVEVSAHEGARPEHAVWQGGIYSLSGTSKKYPDFRKSTGYGTGAGLCGWNCRHTFAPYVDGSPRVWSKDELDRLNNRTVTYNGEEMSYYDATQKQRYIERNIRRWKREVLACDSAGVPNGRAADRLSYWNRMQNDFVEQTGFKKQFDRISVVGYNRSVSSSVTAALKKYSNADRTTVRIVSGARITNVYGKTAREHAKRYYGLVRSMKTDAERIAHNTGYSKETVEAVKRYLFIDKHDLGDSVRQFDEDFAIAQSWQRLIDGRPEPHDITLLKHEIMESELVKNGMSQEAAHIAASQKYNYDAEAQTYYALLKQRKNKR